MNDIGSFPTSLELLIGFVGALLLLASLLPKDLRIFGCHIWCIRTAWQRAIAVPAGIVLIGMSFILHFPSLIQTPKDNFPSELELQFRLTSSLTLGNPALAPDKVLLGVKSPPREAPEEPLTIGKDGFFHAPVGVPHDGSPITALFRGAVDNSYYAPGDLSQYTTLCLARAVPPPSTAALHTRFICQERKACGVFDPLDPGWVTMCSFPAKALGVMTPRLLHKGFSFISEAFAQSPVGVWNIPSLRSLNEHRQSFHDGYTAFTIQGAGFGAAHANGVSLDLHVNNVEARIEGLPGSRLIRNFDPTQPLLLSFGLQNLDFTGKIAGCDTITATLRFWNNESPSGEPIILKREYAALRDAEALTGC